jgi:prepilin-type N-terminal cleavage/methylation domain-containing protein
MSDAPRPRRARRGVTLVELLVVLAILAIVAATVGFSIDPRGQPSSLSARRAALESLRTRAISTGRAVTSELPMSGGYRRLTVTALPNGQLVPPVAERAESMASRDDDRDAARPETRQSQP